MKKTPLELDPRRTFTSRQRGELIEASLGLCDLCGGPAGHPWIAGHIIAHALGGRTEIENGRVECMDCSKGTHRVDTGIVAKAERQGGRKGQWARRLRNGPQIRGQGFFKGKFKRKIGTGKVVER